jgi:hypothetical protein
MSIIQEVYDDVTRDMQPWFKHLTGVPVTAIILTVIIVAFIPLLIMMGLSFAITEPFNWVWKYLRKLFFKEKETKYNERF